MTYDQLENWGLRRDGTYNIETLTRYFREGRGVHWSRGVDDPVEVELNVDSEGRTTGRISLIAVLGDCENAYRGRGIRYSTDARAGNLMDLTRRMETLRSRGLQEENVRVNYGGVRGVSVSYVRNISDESDLSAMMADIDSVQ
jgi:hypothetical protein